MFHCSDKRSLSGDSEIFEHLSDLCQEGSFLNCFWFQVFPISSQRIFQFPSTSAQFQLNLTWFSSVHLQGDTADTVKGESLQLPHREL